MVSYVAAKWWNSSTIAVVTGANKGIGYELARIFAREGLTTVVAARNAELGNKAVAELKSSLPQASIDFVQLDVTDQASVSACAEELKSKYGKVDILLNNAGIAPTGGPFEGAFNVDEAVRTLDCNVRGTRRVSEAVLPLMSDGARIVNVCSRCGMLDQVRSEKVRQQLRKPASDDDIIELVDAYVEGVRNNTYRQQGFSNSIYSMSKVFQMSYTRWQAGHLKDKGIAVYGCCPGYVATDMTSGGGVKSASDGADTPAWLALQPIGSIPLGQLYGERKVVPW